MDKPKQSITCDMCEKELIIDSSYPHSWALKLAPADYGTNTTGMQYAVMCHPAIDREHHFCGLKCLANWSTKCYGDEPYFAALIKGSTRLPQGMKDRLIEILQGTRKEAEV